MANAAIFNALMRPVRSVDDYLATYDARDAQKAQMQQNQLAAYQTQQLREAQIAEIQRRQQAEAAAAQAAQQREAARRAALLRAGPVTGTQANAVTGITGPTPQAAAAIGQRRQINVPELLAEGVPIEQIKLLAEADTLGKPKVARQIEVDDGKGGKRIALVDDYGNEVAGMAGYVAPVQVNQGDKVTFARPQAGVSLPVGMSPSERDSSARGWAGINIQRQAEARQADAAKTAAAGGPSKPLPASALKMQQESLDAIGISSSINADLGSIAKQIDTGKLSFGPIDNLVNTGRNMAGYSSENSRNFASFKSTLERLRNESLRLNAGVQTDGDAQRAWNELFQNINDTGLVKQRLAEIQNINKRGADLHRLRVDSIRSNYNAGPLDVEAYREQPAAVGATPAGKPAKTVKRTGTSNGRKVVEYTDGSIEYAD